MINLEDIPENSGVYLMKKEDKVIYVGKAKNLKKRVSSYFQKRDHDAKTSELVKKIESVEYLITGNEIEALILENNLIKKYLPKYNILLKDEKTYPYIRLTKEKFPKIEIVRNKNKETEKSEYFGPFPVGIYYFYKMIKKIFPIRDCNRDMDKKYDRPCLKFHMKMCAGPCVYKEIEKEYNRYISELKDILGGKSKILINSLNEEMGKASDALDYEKAIFYRERIKEIKKILEKQVAESSLEIDEDVFVVSDGVSFIFILVLNIREGKIIDKNFVVISKEKYLYDDLIDDVFISYYEKYPIPQHIIMSEKYIDKKEIFEAWLTEKNSKKVKLYFPEISSRRKELLNIAYMNIEQEIENYTLKHNILNNGLIKLKEILGLKKYPFRIECFDISNIQGKDAVAAMSVGIKGKPEPKEYRKYKITVKDTPDDFLMMQEVLTRRYSKLEEEELPDVILIDGGKGQLGIAEKVLKKLDKYNMIEIISIAKKEELVFKAGEEEPYVIDRNDEALKILQRIRDEAHRFGITYHRKLRSKRIIQSELDKIEGIGEKRRQILLKKFGSVEKIKKASIEELLEVIPKNIAEKIKEKLK